MKQVGGANKPVVVVTRDTASGTRGAFQDIMGLSEINGKKYLPFLKEHKLETKRCG